jgi:biotin carboxyl carrier protein
VPPRPQRARITRVEIVSALTSWALSIATTAALAAVGWFGHATHWTFGLGGHDAAHAADAGHAHADAPQAVAEDAPRADGESNAVRFRSQEALERTGIELVAVKERPVVSELVVSGVVHYDQRHIAQLSARVPGSVWRVEKHLGDAVRKGDVLLVIESSEVGRLKADFLNALVAHEARREQLAILEEVKSAVMGRQLREAKSALREARNHLTNAEQATSASTSPSPITSRSTTRPAPTASARPACRRRCSSRSIRPASPRTSCRSTPPSTAS